MIPLSPRAGVGFKAAHARSILETAPDGLWLEVHPENYMVAGGPKLAWLEALAQTHALSFHGVGASLGGPDDLDTDHLKALKRLIDRFEPASVSEHATWSAGGGQYFPDLFPIPRTSVALQRLVDQVDRFQSAIGRRILLENPSVYLPIAAEMDEPDFLSEVCRRTGCGLLLDINNVFVSANNVGGDALSYLNAVDARLVGEIHLAGHDEDAAVKGLLIDTHGAAIAADVWALYERVIAQIGPRPTLIERDNNVPAFDVLMEERNRADALLQLERAAP
jgi:uncharacterized protein (UPF0276 family)